MASQKRCGKKNRRKRARLYQPYYMIYRLDKNLVKVGKVIERNDWVDDRNYSEGNYFVRKSDAVNELTRRRAAMKMA